MALQVGAIETSPKGPKETFAQEFPLSPENRPHFSREMEEFIDVASQRFEPDDTASVPFGLVATSFVWCYDFIITITNMLIPVQQIVSHIY